MSHNGIRVAGKFSQDGVFRAGEMQVLITDKHPARLQVDPQLVNLNGGAGGSGNRIGQAQESAHPRQQLFLSKRLGHIIIRACIQRSNLHFLFRTRTQYDNGHIRTRPDPDADIHP